MVLCRVPGERLISSYISNPMWTNTLKNTVKYQWLEKWSPAWMFLQLQIALTASSHCALWKPVLNLWVWNFISLGMSMDPGSVLWITLSSALSDPQSELLFVVVKGGKVQGAKEEIFQLFVISAGISMLVHCSSSISLCLPVFILYTFGLHMS